MHPFDDSVVPEAGQREFNYSGGGLSGTGWSTFFAGLLFALVGGGMFVAVILAYRHNPASVHGPLWVFLVFLGVFFAIGFSIMCAGLAYIRAAWNEKIVLTPTQVAWVDRSGRESVRVSFSQIQHVEETVLMQVRFGPARRTCSRRNITDAR